MSDSHPPELDTLHDVLIRAGDSCAVAAGSSGRLLVTCRGARVLAWEPAPGDANVFWHHPDAAGCTSPAGLASLRGGVGGLRVWFGPEHTYGWDGVPDTVQYTNYVVQADQDPGRYRIVAQEAARVTMEAQGSLHDLRTGRDVGFSIRRSVDANSDIPQSGIGLPPGIAASTIAMENELVIEAGWPEARIDIWQLAQFRVPAWLGFPLRARGEPDVYFNPTNRRPWRVLPDAVVWKVEGASCTKIGFPTRLSTGTVGAWLPAGRHSDEAHLIVWKLPVVDGGDYVDGPAPRRFHDQVTQAWDGFGFCELEYHSPAARPGGPPVRDRSTLTVLRGPRDLLEEVARRELKVPSPEYFR